MKKCVICFTEKDDNQFNDEHVIPDALGGYYHINNVCAECNSKMGAGIDSKLTNHFFSNFIRQELQLAGKKGAIPNPFSGVHHIQDSNEKVKLDFIGGKLTPRLLPKVEYDNNCLRIMLDGSDKHQLQTIIDKKTEQLAKKGLGLYPSRQVITNKSEPSPWITIKSEIDINDFKLALLKIAYEFTVDTIPEFIDDLNASKITKAILNKDFSYKDFQFIGNGFDINIFKPFANFIEFENKYKHYLLLFNISHVGLVCGVNLFNQFNLFVVMSNRCDYIDSDFIIGINDIKQQTFKHTRFSEITNLLFNQHYYRFQYIFHSDEELVEFINNQKDSNFSFYQEKGETPLFSKTGEILYKSISLKLSNENLFSVPYGDCISEIGNTYYMDEDIYIKTLPDKKLHQIAVIEDIRVKSGKV